MKTNILYYIYNFTELFFFNVKIETNFSKKNFKFGKRLFFKMISLGIPKKKTKKNKKNKQTNKQTKINQNKLNQMLLNSSSYFDILYILFFIFSLRQIN